MPLATLSIDLIAELGKLSDGFDKATRLSEKAANDMERNFAGIKNGAVAIGGALASAFAAAEVKDWFKSTVDGLDALNDLKDATGASIENLSALEDIGARTGTSFETVASSLIKFNKVLSESKDGNEIASILKKLGLSAEELKRIDPAEALRQTAVALAQFADDGDKARYVQVLFGKSVQETAPFLKDLAEQTRLNGKVTTEQTRAAEEFNNQLAELKKNSVDAGRGLVNDLLPAMNSILLAFKEAKQSGQGSFLDGLLGTNQSARLKAEAAATADAIARTTDSIERMQEALQRKGGAGSDQFLETRIEKARQRLVNLQADAAQTTQKLKDLANVIDGGPKKSEPEGSKPSIGTLPEVTSTKISELDKYIERLKDAQAAVINFTEEEKVRFEVTFGKLSSLSEVDKARLIDIAKTTDLLRQQLKVVQELNGPVDIDEEAQRRRNSLQSAYNDIIAKTPTQILERQRDLQLKLAAAYEQGRFGIVGSKEALDAYLEAVNTALPELEKLKDESTEFAKQAARNIQDEFGATIKKTLKGDFDSIAKDWENLLLELVSQAIAADLAGALFGNKGGSGSMLGGLLGTLFGGSTGAGGGAGGGATPAPSLDGTVIASSGREFAASAKPSSVTTINNNYNVTGPISRNEIITTMQQFAAASDANVTKRLRAAGVA